MIAQFEKFVAKRRKEDEKKAEGWIVSYADLMTLLFCVFIVLYALKPEGKGKTDRKIDTIVTMIRESFNEIPDPIPKDQSVEPSTAKTKVFSYFRADQMHPPILKRYQRNDKIIPVINKEMQEVMKKIEIILFENKRPDLDPKPDRHRPISVLPDKDGFTVRLLSSYFYEPGEYRITGDALRKVEQIGKILKELKRRVVIEGHTDTVPKEGPIGNWELSALRASYIARIFVDSLEFPAEQVASAGYADSRPIATNRTPEGRRLNRRVEIKVEYNE